MEIRNTFRVPVGETVIVGAATAGLGGDELGVLVVLEARRAG